MDFSDVAFGSNAKSRSKQAWILTDFSIGQSVEIAGAGGFSVVSIIDGTMLELSNLGTDLLSGNDNAAPGTNIAAGANLSPQMMYTRTIDADGH